jgi:hypothetical protein
MPDIAESKGDETMSETPAVPRSAQTIRWIARIWTSILLAVVVLEIITPDPYVTEPVPAADWFLLSLWGVAILGLLLAWRWEVAGAAAAITAMCLREIAFFFVKGFWHPAFLLVWVFIIPPAVLFLAARGLERRKRKQAGSA